MKKPAACQKGKVRVQKNVKPVINKTPVITKLLSWVMAAGSVASCPDHAAEQPIRVGSACSGWNSELMALEVLRMNFASIFSCECDDKVRALGSLMHTHQHVYENCCTEEFLRSPGCDLFMAGFPCQPFSRAGKNQGVQDSLGRGLVIFWLLRWLWLHKPRSFVLENVGNFAQQHKQTLQIILEVLAAFQIYVVEWKVLENSEVGFLPQHRDRLFIVGVLRSALTSPLAWPSKVDMLPLTKFFAPNHQASEVLGIKSLNASERKNVKESIKKIKQRGHAESDHYVCDISGSTAHVMHERSPCLTVTRAASSGHWLSWLGRKMTTSEILALQGVRMQRVGDYSQHVTERQLRQIAGNAVPIPMLARVIDMVLLSSGMK